MFVRCPSCHTVFRANARILNAASGMVHCGRCGETFCALGHLFDDAAEALAVREPAKVAEAAMKRRGQQPADASGETATAAPAPEPAPSTAGIEPGAAPSPAAEAAGTTDVGAEAGAGTEPKAEVATPAAADERREVPAEAPLGSPSAPETPATPAPTTDSADEPATPPPTAGSADEAPVPPPAPEDAVVSDRPPPEPIREPAPVTPLFKEETGQEQIRDGFDEGYRSLDLRGLAAGDEVAEAAGAEEPELPPQLREDSPESVSVGRRLAGIAAVVLLTLLLAGQWVYLRAEQLVVLAPEARPWVEAFCRQLHCVVDSSGRQGTTAAGFVIQSTDVSLDESADRLLIAHIRFHNPGPANRPYPVLQLTLTDLSGGRHAGRRFTPPEYLPAGTDASAPIPAGESREVTLELLYPGFDPAAYEFELL